MCECERANESARREMWKLLNYDRNALSGASVRFDARIRDGFFACSLIAFISTLEINNNNVIIYIDAQSN